MRTLLTAFSIYLIGLSIIFYDKFYFYYEYNDVEKALLWGAWWIYFHLLIFLMTLCVLWFRKTITKNKNLLLVLFLLASFLALLGLNRELNISLRILTLLVWLFLSSLGFKWHFEKVFKHVIPFYVASILLLIFIEVVLLCLGIFGFVYNLVYYAIVLAGLASFFISLSKERLHGLFVTINEHLPSTMTGWLWVEANFLLLCVAVSLVALPEVLTDATQLHLLKTKFIIDGHGIIGILDCPYKPFFYFPSFLHVLFSFAFALFGDVGAKTLCLYIFILIYPISFSLSRSMKIERSLVYVCIGFLMMTPAFYWMIPSCYLDFPTTILALGGTVLIMESVSWERGKGSKDFSKKYFYLFIAGLFFGAALNSKLHIYPYLAVLLFLVVVYNLWAHKRIVEFRSLKNFLAGIFIICGLHFAVMYILTDNPVYPLANNIFHSPYWNNKIKVSQFVFHDFSFVELMLFPFVYTFNASWFGSIQDGAVGMWMIFFIPLLIYLVKNRDRLTFVIFGGIVLYIFCLNVLDSNYYRYYIVAAYFLAFIVSKLALCAGYKFNRPCAKVFFFVTTLYCVVICFPAFSIAIYPNMYQWKYYRSADRQEWMNLYFQSDFASFVDYVGSLPLDAVIMADGLEMASNIPRKTIQIDTAMLGRFVGLNNIYPWDIKKHRNPTTLWIQENILGYRYDEVGPRCDEIAQDATFIEAYIRYYADVYAVFNVWSFQNHAKQTSLITADRLLYSSAMDNNSGGVFNRFIVAFRSGELIAKPCGYYVDSKGRKQDEYGAFGPVEWFEMEEDGALCPADDLSDPFKHEASTLISRLAVPGGVQYFSFIVEFEYIGAPDLSVGLAVVYYDGDGQVLKESYPAIFSHDFMAAYVVREDIPAGAEQVEIKIRPNPGKRVGVSHYSFFMGTDA